MYREATRIADTYAADLYNSEISLETVQEQMESLSYFMDTEIWIINPSGRMIVNSADAPDPEIRSMLISCRQNDVDFIAVGHGFTTIPPLMFTYATHFAVFATTDAVARRKNCVINFPALVETVNMVNREALASPHTFKIIKNE